MRSLRSRPVAAGLQAFVGSETLPLDPAATTSVESLAALHIGHAALAAIDEDDGALLFHAARVRTSLPHLAATSLHAIGVAMAGLAGSIELAALTHGTVDGGDRHERLIADMAEHERWLGERAAENPRRFAHLHWYVVALRCAARFPFEPAQLEPALRAFDLAARTALAGRRGLQAAFLLEQAARFHRSQNLEETGHDLMVSATAHYARLGMARKAEEMRARWLPADIVPPREMDPPERSPDSCGADRLALSQVWQALAGVSDWNRLVKRIVDVIGRASGATDVGLFVRQAFDVDAADLSALPSPTQNQTPTLTSMQPTDPSRWTLVAVARAGQPAMAMRESAAMAGMHGFTPGVVRHALSRTHAETIDDVHHDRRFGRDAEAEAAHGPSGSALLLPLRSRGRPDALLLIENRLATHFFTTDHVDALELVAGQLSVALHDALLHRAMAQRTASTARNLKHTVDDIALRDRALAAATEAVSILDATSAEFVAVYVNAAFEALTGYTRDEVLGRSLYRLYGADTAQPGIETLRDAVRRGVECHATVRCYRKNGEMFWNEVSVAPVFDDDARTSHHVCVNRDVTERRRQADAERLRSERLEAVFALSPDGVVVLDAGHRVTSVNPAFGSITGLDVAGLIGMDASEFDAILAARTDGARVVPWPSEQPATVRLAEPERRVLLRHTRRGMDGRQDTVLYFRDITRQFEVDRMKSDFLATVAHELRAPMTSVSRFTGLLLDHGLTSTQRNEMLEVLHHQTAALAARLDELLDLARTEDGTG